MSIFPYPFFILFFLPSFLLAQEKQEGLLLSSGPKPGTELTPVVCYATDGPNRGLEFDAAKQIGKSPSAFLFIHELTRNTAPVLRGLDNLASEFSIVGFRSFSIMLTGDRTAGEAQLKRVNGSLRLGNPIVLSTDGAEGPGNYALNRKAALTLVLANGGKVTKSLALTDTGPNDVPMIRSAIEEMCGKIPDDEGALRGLIAKNLPSNPENLKRIATDQALEVRRLKKQLARLREQSRGAGMQRRPQQRPMRRETPDVAPDKPKPKREGKPPEDPKLLSLLRPFIRKTNEDARTDEIYAEITARAAEGKELNSQAVEMFKLMLSIDYGSPHAQKLARKFLDEQKAGEKQ